ncbi:MAG TPA: hypothetical protein VNY74_08440, partial [Edaphobacter sp.]|nr:hypothetical protein [Edaphobacter sp.]
QHTAFWRNTAAKKRRNEDRLDHLRQTRPGRIALIRLYPSDHRYAFELEEMTAKTTVRWYGSKTSRQIGPN